MIITDLSPFHLEPWRVTFRRRVKLGSELVDTHKPPISDFVQIDVYRAVVSTIVHPAILVFGSDGSVLGVILELVELR